MDKAYNHSEFEGEIYKKWQDSKAFEPIDTSKEVFSIIMPPPNANDPLHLGHAMFVAVEDILVRYHRMKGEATLWLPGTDHAGIETQYVYEKKLAKQDKSRFDFDRDTLFKLIWDYVLENSGVATQQMKRLGASADWSRFKFTLDEKIVKMVEETFIKLDKDGLVYRGERLVNYCPKCGTAYSELEVDYEERNDPMYFMKYGPFIIATARPETKFRDTALAVNPNDSRYKDYLGKTIEVQGLLGPVKMTVIADEEVDPEFGTGIMKVTPAHDPHDFELGKRYNLPVTPIIDFNGRMDFSWYLNDPDFETKEEKYKERAKRYQGKKVAEMRKIMAVDLAEDGLIDHMDEKYVHRVGVCYRCKSVIEPLPLPQFFIKVRGLADGAIAALDKNETQILGAGRDKILRDWLTNLKDWNVSRQVVWGIRMPVWYDTATEPKLRVTFIHEGQKIMGEISELGEKYSLEDIAKGLQVLQAPREAKYTISIRKPGETYLQETDTFDTWFSSGQWPVVTLKAGEENDFDRFYPTNVMETAYDILPFWVMRMMMLGIYVTGKSPFSHVYLHGLVRDEKGRKMSKSIGNVINPIDMVDKYGADAVRMALVMSSTAGQDKSVGENVIKGMRNFSNKIWNAARFVNMLDGVENGAKDEEFKSKLNQIVAEISEHLENLRPGQAAEAVYGYFWHWYCDVAIEQAKSGDISKTKIVEGLKVFLTLLHPFAPFVTEAVWQEMGYEGLLIRTMWPARKTN